MRGQSANNFILRSTFRLHSGRGDRRVRRRILSGHPFRIAATVHSGCRRRDHAVSLWTGRPVQTSVMGGKPEKICSVRGLPPMTHSGHRQLCHREDLDTRSTETSCLDEQAPGRACGHCLRCPPSEKHLPLNPCHRLAKYVRNRLFFPVRI